jgi:hypothetical protein
MGARGAPATRQFDDMGKASLDECKVTKAAMYANPDKPDTHNPNCSLDLDISEYSMKELQKGILTGMEPDASTGCYNTTLTIDRNTKRVYLSFTRTQYADKYDKSKFAPCGSSPRTEVLMNCTYWAGERANEKGQRTPPRYCDFSSSGDK